jgi:hypothetical protein
MWEEAELSGWAERQQLRDATLKSKSSSGFQFVFPFYICYAVWKLRTVLIIHNDLCTQDFR